MIKRIVAILVVFIVFIGSTTFVESVTNYDKLMVNTLVTMRTNVVKKNPNFLMVINGGYNLYLPKARTKNDVFKVIDGVIIEDAFTHNDKHTMQKSLGEAIKKHKKAFALIQQGYHKETDTFCSFLPLFRHLFIRLRHRKRHPFGVFFLFKAVRR